MLQEIPGVITRITAVQAIESKCAVQEIDYAMLRTKLEELGQFLVPSSKKVKHTQKVQR